MDVALYQINNIIICIYIYIYIYIYMCVCVCVYVCIIIIIINDIIITLHISVHTQRKQTNYITYVQSRSFTKAFHSSIRQNIEVFMLTAPKGK